MASEMGVPVSLNLLRGAKRAHALRSNDPVVFLEHRKLLAIKGPVPQENYEIPFGHAKVVRSPQPFD